MKFLYSFLILTNLSTIYAQYTKYDIIKEVQTKNKGVVVSAHPLASNVGAKILQLGGNAFDAAIATQWALAVVYPQAGNIGGGGFLVASKADGQSFALDYREKAPLNATRDMYLDEKKVAQTNLSQKGPMASGVPGTVDGLYTSLQYAKLPMHQLIQPAIDLATKGYAITLKEANLLNHYKDDFIKNNRSKTVFIQSKIWNQGDILVQTELGETLKRIQKNGRNGFYQGKTADLIVNEMNAGKGKIQLKDLNDYHTVVRKALTFPYKGNEIITMPLPSSGGILLQQMLTMVSLGGIENYQANTTQAVQLMVEAERRAFADRAKYMGDPDFVKDYTQEITNIDYLKKRFSNFSWDKATPSSELNNDTNLVKESEQTTHLSVIDKYGNAVAVTTTLNDLYGCKTVVSGAGFFLNNEMDDFSIKPGVPNLYGAIGGEANAIQANKRMLSSMTPTIVRKNGKIKLIVGSPGGTTIPTTVFQSIVNVIDFNLDANQTVSQAKFHHQWLPEVVFVENKFPQEVILQLQKKNYIIEKRAPIGKTELILLEDNGTIHAVADGRGDDSVGLE